ncbi:MAG: HAD family hydrolase [Selenomonadaceae bacterium]|nr:HAD family hydrolase [Selenomonadaceae bacterium]
MCDKAVFFDRDGTLNVDKNYLYKIEDFEWITGAPEAIKYVRSRGYKAIVITNQSGVARGMYTIDDVNRLHAYMNESLKAYSTKIDGFYFCPHHKNGSVPEFTMECDCRKPKSGLLIQAARDFKLSLSESVMFGDKERDVECAQNAGARGVLFDPADNLLLCVKKYL